MITLDNIKMEKKKTLLTIVSWPILVLPQTFFRPLKDLPDKGLREL
jgi:hypothetical protein